MAKLTITLIKSTNSANKKQVATVQAIGLNKIGQTVQQEATPSVLGMVRHVAHLVRCEET